MNTPTRILAAALLALGLAACQNHASAPQPPMQLKLYNVPPQKSEALMMALRSAITNGKSARVSRPLPGKLLVAAPADEQVSIGAAIAALSKASATSAPPGQYTVHFWLIDMLPGDGTEPATLQPLSATLATLRKRMGPAHFVLADTAMATTMESQHSNKIHTANQHLFEFWIPSTSTGHVHLALQYIDQTGKGFRELKTTASTRLGDYVVLAQAAAPEWMPDHSKAPPKGAMRLLVVRVDKLEPGAR